MSFYDDAVQASLLGGFSLEGVVRDTDCIIFLRAHSDNLKRQSEHKPPEIYSLIAGVLGFL